jgi:hypothetical protein
MIWMNRTLVVSIVLWAGIGQAAQVTEEFLDALEHIESNGDPNAIGDSGRAVGAYQIWKIYVAEANRILRLPVFGPEDRRDREASRYMTRVVLTHWARYHERHGRKIGYAELASLHRHPCAAWRPCELATKHEQNRTKKLLQYLKISRDKLSHNTVQ